MRPTRTALTGVTLVVTAAALWSVAQAAGAVAAGNGGEVDFFIQDTKQATVHTVPGATTPNQGDLFAYHGVVYDKKGGKAIGRFGGACVQLDATAKKSPLPDMPGGDTPSDSSCSLDYVLPDGQLHTEIFGANDLVFSGKPFPFSIIGGTGKYRNARGEGTMAVPDVKNQTDGYVKIKVDS